MNDLIYRIRFQITPPEAWDENSTVPDQRTVYTLHAPPVAHEKLEQQFHPRKIDILHYDRVRYLP